jgi:O-antigen/teichoic acid export membrane protein
MAKRVGESFAVTSSAEQDPALNETSQDILDSPLAGPRLIRGAATRTTGYLFGLGLALLAVPLLTRHLGVENYGNFIVVTSLVAIASMFADAGLTAVGVREYTVRDSTSRRRFLETLVSARLLISVVAGVGAVGFAAIAGYERLLVVGTALGSIGLVFTIAQRTYAIPLTAALRLQLTTALEVLRQALMVGGILTLVAAGAGLLGFFVLPIPVGFVVLLMTLVAVRGYGVGWPSAQKEESRYLLGEMSAAAASVLAALFYRVAIVMMSLLATAQETGYFGLSLQVVDVFVMVPAIICGSALPVLARAADTDEQRLTGAFRQLFDVSIILGVGTAFVLTAGAEPIVAFLGGPNFAPAVPVLQIQGLSVAVTFLVTLFGYMLWVFRARRQLIAANLLGMSTAIILTAALVPGREAKGAATAMLLAESVLASLLGIALFRRAPYLRPSPKVLAKSLVAVLLAAAVTLAPLSPLVSVVVGATIYLAVLIALRAFPADVWAATIGTLRSGRA